MLPWIAGAVVIGVGAYLLDEAQSENRRARRRYENEYNSAVSNLKRSYKHAKKKEKLDKLFKVKRAKRKVADAIYEEMKALEKSYKAINMDLKRTKLILNELIDYKKRLSNYKEKSVVQKRINIIQDTRKELFPLKDSMKRELYSLKEANIATRLVQDRINKVLKN